MEFLSVTDNLTGALALHEDNRGNLIVIQSRNLYGERGAGSSFLFWFVFFNAPEGSVSTNCLSLSGGCPKNPVCYIKDN